MKDMNGFDKRRILETFVENDDVLGLLLDFISNRNVQPASDSKLDNNIGPGMSSMSTAPLS